MNRNKLLNLVYQEQMEKDSELSKLNISNLVKTRDIEAFEEAEAKRKEIFEQTSKDILELISLLDEKGIE